MKVKIVNHSKHELPNYETKASAGTIDADYRGEINIILANISNETFVVNDGDRIAQMVIARHEQAEGLR